MIAEIEEGIGDVGVGEVYLIMLVDEGEVGEEGATIEIGQGQEGKVRNVDVPGDEIIRKNPQELIVGAKKLKVNQCLNLSLDLDQNNNMIIKR